MNDRVRLLTAVFGTVMLFLGVQLGALALVEPLHESERQAVENPDDPTNSFVFVAVIIVATAIMLAAFKYDAKRFIRALIVGVSVMLSWFVFVELFPASLSVEGVNVLPVVAALGVGVALLTYPEWYVIDVTGVLMGAGAAGLFGISFGLLPAIVFLVVLAVYDAISVYKTKHMLSLADGVMDLKIPVVFVVPTTLSFSYLESASTAGVLDDSTTNGSGASVSAQADDAGAAAESRSSAGGAPPTGSTQPTDVEQSDDSVQPTAPEPSGDSDEPTDAGGAPDPDGEPTQVGDAERDALFIGLGDAVIPTILVASAAHFLDASAIDVPLLTLNVPALGALLGTITGLLVLMHMVLKGRPHAGLPLLNGGAIAGYLLGALASGISIATAVGL